MKYVILLILIGTGYYLYEKQGVSSSEIDVKTHRDIYLKMESSPVSKEEILVGVTEFAMTMCNDSGFQLSAGETTNSCINKLDNFKSMCSERIFGNGAQFYTEKAKVTSLAKRFINCVGT